MKSSTRVQQEFKYNTNKPLGTFQVQNFSALWLSGMVLIIGTLLLWCPFRVIGDLPKERIPGAIGAGLRYARYSPPLKATFFKAFAFFISASAFGRYCLCLLKQSFKVMPKCLGYLSV
jgi:hypothetical protein